MATNQTRLLLGLGSVLVLLLGVLVWGDAPENPSPGTPQWRPAADGLTEAEVLRVTLHEADQAVVLVRNQGTWQLTHPYAATADETQVSSLVSTLQRLEVSEPLGPTDGGPYGLDPGSPLEAVLSTQETLVLWVGDDAPTGRGTYLRLGDGSIRVSQGPVRGRFMLGADDLRSRSVVRFSPAGVTGVRAASPAEGSWSLLRDEEGWWLSAAAGTDRADAGAVNSFLGSLEALQVDTFVDGLGLLDPGWTVLLDTLDGPRSVVLGKGTGEARMVAGSALSEPALVRLPPSLAALDPARFRARALLFFTASELGSFEVELGSDAHSAARAGEEWPTTAAASTVAALAALSADRTRGVPDPEGTPWGRVQIEVRGGGTQEVQFFQQDGEGRVAVDAAGGDPFWVAQAALDALASEGR